MFTQWIFSPRRLGLFQWRILSWKGRGVSHHWATLWFSIFQNSSRMPFIVDDTDLLWFCFPLSRKRCATTSLSSLLLRCHQLSFVCWEELESYNRVPTPSFPVPFTIFDSHQLYPISPGKTSFWTSSVLGSLIPLIFCLQLHDLLHPCYHTGKAADLLAQLCPLLAVLVFHSCLSQISNGYPQVLAEASSAYLTYSFLMSYIHLAFKTSE